jgi:tetratricopeptide (TPR) repeat protein
VSDERLEALRAMLAEDPADAFTRYALAMELKGLGRKDEASTEFGAVLAADPSYLATYYQYGALLHSEGESQQALEVIRRGIDAAQAAGDRHTTGALEDLLEEVDG